MKLKRFFATVTLVALCLTSFAACSKKESNQETAPTPTASVSKDNTSKKPTPTAVLSSISLGGTFKRENITLSLFLADSWQVNGIYYDATTSSYQVLNGPLIYKEGTKFIFSDADNELSFTVSEKSLAIKATKGTDYAIFEGTFDRVEQSSSASGPIAPKEDSVLELIGFTSVTHYMLLAEDMLDCTIQTSKITTDNKYMTDFILAYTDLFYVPKADFYEDVSTKYLCYAFTSEKLNEVLMAASNDRFGVKDFDLTGTEIVRKGDTYYVPCLGKYAGGILTHNTDSAPETIPEDLVLDGTVTIKGDATYHIEMDISTTSENPSKILGVAIDSVHYKVTK